MYSRYYGNRPSRPIELPENYSGCAFVSDKEAKAEELPRLPTPPRKDLPPLKRPQNTPVPPCEEKITPPTEEAPPLLPPISTPSAKQDSELDRLLILGLLLLLVQSGEDSELVLWLLLLLFL